MASLVCATFATSSKVTGETFTKLNSSYPKDGDMPPHYKNFFDPVRRDIDEMLKPSKQDVDFVVDVFQESISELNKLYDDNIGKQITSRGFFSCIAWAALDERSSQDDTVLIQYDELTYGDDDQETGSILHSWRVKFADAYDVVRYIEDCSPDVIEQYIIKGAERCTDADGVFNLAKAVEAVNAGERA